MGRVIGESKAENFWRSYLSALAAGSPLRDEGYEAWSFGDGPEMADRPGALVRDGLKTATCSALWELEAEGASTLAEHAVPGGVRS